MNELNKLTDSDLRGLATALRSGRLDLPYAEPSLERVIGKHAAALAQSTFKMFGLEGLQPRQIAIVLDTLLADRKGRPAAEDVIDLVMSGPEGAMAANRDTAVVVRDLFSSAQESVLVVGYVIYQGQHVFRSLADRMLERPTLKVEMFLDIPRPPGDEKEDGLVVQQFLTRFRTQQWPIDGPLPHLFFGPRSLRSDQSRRSCLHAKCVVVDYQTVFVSSANFTEAAQERNVEVGLLVRSASVAKHVCDHFTGLRESGLFEQAHWPRL